MENGSPRHFPDAVIPIPNQSGIFVGSSFCSSTYYLYAFVASILAALMSSLDLKPE
jgi:hypothetical protein